MDIFVPRLYKDYANYVNTRKMVPDSTDGLLPVQRRVLLAAHLIAKGKFTKTIKVLSEAAAKFHPFSLAEGTAAWLVLNKLLDGSGQWGAIQQVRKVNAAAPRYTSVKANPFVEELAFKLVDFVPWEIDEMDPEPIKLPTMIPISLFLKYELSMIAFGYKPVIPTYTLSDLIKRLMFLLGKGEEVVIKPTIKNCKTLSGIKECRELLETGKGKIEVVGKHKIDEKNMCIYVKGWSTNISFETLFSRIDKYKDWKLLSNGDIGYIDQTGGEADDDSDVYNEKDPLIKFEVNKQRNKAEIFEKMKEAVVEKLKATHSYNIVVVHDNETTEYNVDNMLLNAYNFYKIALEKYFQHSKKEAENKISEFNNIIKLRPHVSDVAVEFKEDFEKACTKLSKLSGLSFDETKQIVDKYRIKKLLTINVDLTDLQSQIKKFQHALNNLDTISIGTYTNLLEALK